MRQTPNYFCTWHLMYWFPDNGGVPNLQTRDVLCDELLFGENGIAARHYPEVRKDLYLLLDDGWDVKSSHGSALSGYSLGRCTSRRCASGWRKTNGTVTNGTP